MRKGMNILKKMKEMGDTSYILEKMFYKDKIVKYTEIIPIGWMDYKNKKNVLYMDFRNTNRILILGKSGSGKTWLARSLMNRLYLAGILPIIMTDIAPEYYTSKYPVQKEFERFILSEEKPVSLPIKPYYPFFLSKFFDIEIEDMIKFQFSIKDTKPQDIAGFFDYENLSLSMKLEIENIIFEMSERDRRFESIEDLKKFISERDISQTIKMPLLRMVDNMKNLGIFGEDYEPPRIIEDINNNIIPNFILYGWQGTDVKRYISIYISLLIREILLARQQRKIKEGKHIILFFEELHEFAPKRGTSSQEIVKKEIEKAVLTGRKEKISFIFVTQTPENVSPIIISQCDYIFIPSGFDTSKIMSIIKEIAPSYYSTPYDFGIDVTSMMKRLRTYEDGMREWLCIKRGGSITPFSPLGPLTHHKIEGEVLR